MGRFVNFPTMVLPDWIYRRTGITRPKSWRLFQNSWD
jgi:hypothetical protein